MLSNMSDKAKVKRATTVSFIRWVQQDIHLPAIPEQHL